MSAKNVIKVELSGEKLYFTPVAYKEWRLSLSTGDFHCHKHTRIKRAPKKSLVTNIKQLRFQQIMPELARLTGLTHDSGDDDRLFDETLRANSMYMTEAEYDAMESDINSFNVRGAGFVVYAWNDSSGYDYWTVRQQENNYIQITAAITDPMKVDAQRLRLAIRRARDHFSHYEFDFEHRQAVPRD